MVLQSRVKFARIKYYVQSMQESILFWTLLVAVFWCPVIRVQGSLLVWPLRVLHSGKILPKSSTYLSITIPSTYGLRRSEKYHFSIFFTPMTNKIKWWCMALSTTAYVLNSNLYEAVEYCKMEIFFGNHRATLHFDCTVPYCMKS